MSRISNCDDIIDTRMVLDRIEELEGEYVRDVPEDGDELTFAPSSEWNPDDQAEYDSLRALVEEVTGEAEYENQLRDGIVLVHESYWEAYAKDWYADTYSQPWIKSDKYGRPEYDQVNHRHVHVTWDDVMDTEPFGFIDWQRAADHLRRNQAEIEWEGVTYIVG